MNILVLGGTGAMGAPLSKLLVASGNNVYVTSRSAHKSCERLHYLQGNAKDEIFLKACLSRMHYDAIVDFMSYSTNQFDRLARLLLQSTKQYIFISSARIFAESKVPLTENSPRLLETVQDLEYKKTDEYALAKARQEDILYQSGFSNYTIVRPSVTYNTYRLQLGALEKENWLYRALKGRCIVFSNDIADKYTAMTHGDDVAKAICAVIGKRECLKQSYNIVTDNSLKWQDILTIYLCAIEEFIGKCPKVVMSDETIKLKDKKFKYQVIYARRLNRKFDNTKIEKVYHEKFISPKEGLSIALKDFLKDPLFHSINWKYEAWSDNISKEYTPLSEIPTLRNKFMYLCYRHQVGWIFKASQGLWHRLKNIHNFMIL